MLEAVKGGLKAIKWGFDAEMGKIGVQRFK
jgi:hypothetical protein